MPDYTADTIRVLGNRLAPGFSETLGSVRVIDSSWLSGAIDVSDALTWTPRVWIRQRGLPGVQTDVITGPGNYTQTSVLINNVRFEDPQTPHHNFDLPVDIEEIQRVDVAQGGASAIAGPGSSAGAVNLVTKKPVNGMKLVASGGSFGTVKTGVDLGNSIFGIGAWAGRSDGYRPGSDYAKWKVSAKARTLGFNIFAAYLQKEFGARDFYAPYPSREWTSAGLLTISKGNFSLGLRRHTDRFVLIESEPEFYENYHTKIFGICSYGVLMGPGYVGLEASGWQLSSNNLGHHSAPGFGIFYQTLIDLHRMKLAFVVREDWRGGTGFAPSASAGLVWNLGNTRCWTSFSRSTRFPSATEMFYYDPYNTGDPELEPEISEHLETGLGIKSIKVSVFWTRFKQLIDWIKNDESEPWQAVNLDGISAKGLCITIERGWFFSSYSFQYLNSPEQLISKYALRIPSQSLKLGCPYAFLSFEDGVCLLSANVAFQRDPILFKLFGRNLLDQYYEPSPGLPGPGRSFGIKMVYIAGS